jgi:DNA polymerase III alpha subunit
MFTNEDIKQIINDCRGIGDAGLSNKIHASIPDLTVDIVKPPIDFLGTSGNPAIFINKATFKLLGSLHSNWIVDKTIALKISLLNQAPIEVIGAIVHETGHAFNVAAKIENTEANAYIFEIEAMLQLLKAGTFRAYGCTESDVYSYFKSRLTYYIQGAKNNEYLATVIEKTKSQPKPIPQKSSLPKIEPVFSTLIIDKEITLVSIELSNKSSSKEVSISNYKQSTGAAPNKYLL